jgi:hypothetical protein
MAEIITEVAQATPERLTAILRAGGHLPQGEVVAVSREAGPRAGSIIVPLALTYSAAAPPSAPRRMILKLPRPDGLNTADQREVEFYSRIATSMSDPPVIRCYDVAYSKEVGRFHLLLEDLAETHLSHPPSFLPPSRANAERIVEALAQIHACWWDHPRLGQDIGVLPTEGSLRADMAWAEKTFPAFADFLGDRLSPARRRIYERLFHDLLPRQAQRLTTARGLTLIHDDPHSGNFLYPRDPAKDRLRVIDWKSWGITTGVSDMAHLMTVFWFPERRAQLEQPLLRLYYERLLAGGVEGYDWAACRDDYRLAVLGYLVYPLWQWSVNSPDFIWWHNLERLMLAVHDLDCLELLDT